MGHRVTIAGASGVAQGLSERLKDEFDVRRVSDTITPTESAWPADLTSIAQTEIACANTQTLVVLARTTRSRRRFRGLAEDVDRLLADSLARAAQRCGVQHLVLFACGAPGADVRESIMRASGLPTTVLRGGGPDPVQHLENVIRRGPGGDVEGQPWAAKPAKVGGPPAGFSSVQRFPRPEGWSAAQLAQAYFRWLSTDVPAARVVSSADAETIHLLGTKVLVLRRLNGQAEPDAMAWEITGGALARPGGRLELRVLLDGVSVIMHLRGFRTRLPGALYSLTQAKVHERVVHRFGEWVGKQPRPSGLPPVTCST